MCAGKIGAVTLKAHGVGLSRMSSCGWKSRLTALQKPTIHHKAGLALLFVPREWKAYLWGLSPVNCSSLYLNILSSVFSLCLGSDTVDLLLVCSVCATRRKTERGWRTAPRERAGWSGEEPGDSEHVTGGQCGGRWRDEWLRCESLSLMEASTSTKLSHWSMRLAHLQPCVELRAFSLWALCSNIPLCVCAWVEILILFQLSRCEAKAAAFFCAT